MMRQAGFTLVELMIASSMFALLSVAIYAVISATVEATATSTAESVVQQSLRDAMSEMTREIQIAAAENDPTLVTPLFGLVVDQVGGAPTGVTFQVPTDNTGVNWTRPISYGFLNEDDDGDARLDAGEDDDDDGVLSRRIIRRQDINGDGDTNDPNEIRQIATANDISNVQFAFDGAILTITLTATKQPNHNRNQAITATLTGNVFLMN